MMLRFGHIGLTCTLGLLFALVGGSGRGTAQTPPATQGSRLGPAALTLEGGRSYSLAGRVVRCQQGQRVGIAAQGREPMVISDVTVEGCEVGLAAAGLSIRLERVLVRGEKLRGCTIGIFQSGSSGTATDNIVRGCAYGIVISGDQNTVERNQSNDNSADGILITGDSNSVVGNEALRNGQVGIHVASMAPMISPNKVLSFIQDLAVGNTIRENTALNNKVDLAEFGECEAAPFPPLPNDWSDNTFETRQPACID
jgi:copper-binding protein NosD